jgi:rhamnosyltransferase
VIVTYFPDRAGLQALLDTTLAQVERVVLVDNTPQTPPFLAEVGSARCHVVANGRNAGLAEAQNQGIGIARASGCDHVLLLDDDSQPAPDMVRHLWRALEALRARGVAVAAVGPRWHDRHAGRDAPFVRVGFGRTHNIGCDGAAPPGATIECDTLVSSGCLIPMASLDRIGPMDASLFIDQVDVEWGLRAQAHGFGVHGACDAVLYHGIGTQSVRPWFARGRSVPVHAPVRDYYLVRNILTVFFLRPAPWRWRLLQLVRLPALVLVMVTQMPPRMQRLRLIARGVVDALRRRLGPAPAP